MVMLRFVFDNIEMDFVIMVGIFKCYLKDIIKRKEKF